MTDYITDFTPRRRVLELEDSLQVALAEISRLEKELSKTKSRLDFQNARIKAISALLKNDTIT